MPKNHLYKKSIHTIYLDPTQNAKLVAIADATKLTKAYLIREAIDLWLLARERGKKVSKPQT